MATHALGDRLGELIDFGLLVCDQERHVRRAPEGLGIATQGGAVVLENLSFTGEHPRPAPAVPVVGVLGDDAQGHLLAAAADHELGMGLLNWLGIERSIGELIVASLERGAALPPQRADDLAGLVEPLEPLAHRVKGNAIGRVLVLLPPCAQAEHETSTGDDVDLGGHLRDNRRMTIRVAQDDGAEPHPRHEGRQSAEGAPRLQHGALALCSVVDEVVVYAGDVPAGSLQVSPELQHARPVLPSHAGEDAEAHVSISSFWVLILSRDVILSLRGGPMAIIRIHTGSDGKSHFDEIMPKLDPRGDRSESAELSPGSGITIRRFEPSRSNPWHHAPGRAAVFTLAGAVDIEIGDGTARRLGPGDILIAEDLTGQGHVTREVGPEPRVSIFVPLPG